jgi:hypothetical protein
MDVIKTVHICIYCFVEKKRKKNKKKLGDLYKIRCTGCVHTIDGAPSGATALD